MTTPALALLAPACSLQPFRPAQQQRREPGRYSQTRLWAALLPPLFRRCWCRRRCRCLLLHIADPSAFQTREATDSAC